MHESPERSCLPGGSQPPAPPLPLHDEETVNLLDYLEVIAKRWRLIVGTGAVALVLSTGLSLQIKNVYSSTALVLPPQQDSGMLGMMNALSGGMATLASDLLGKGSPADMYVGILNSRVVMDTIIDRFKLLEVYRVKYRLDAYKVLDRKVEIEVGKKDGIISVTVEDQDPKRAAAMANAYLEELGKMSVKLNVTGAGENRSYLEQRLAKTKVTLSQAEDALKQFQTKNKALDVPEQAKASIVGVAQLRAQLAAQEVQLAALRSRFTDSTQEVKDLRASNAKLEGQIARLEGNGPGGAIPSLGSVPALGEEYVRLLREFKVQEAVFEMLTKQYEMAKFSESRNVDGLQIIQNAAVPDKKVKPKRSLIVLAATLGAAAAAALYALMAEAGAKLPPEDREQLGRIRRLILGGVR